MLLPRSRLAAALPGALVALLAVASLLPGVWRGTLPGEGTGPVDGIHSVFYYEAAARRLMGLADFGHIEEMWFPVGRPLLLAQLNVVDALLAAPLVAVLGAARGTALFVVLTLASNAVAGAWLAARVNPSVVARLAGALVLGFCPFVADELEFGRYTQMWLAPTAVAVGLAWGAAQGGRRAAILTGLAVAFAGYHYWFYGAFAALLVAGVMLGRGGGRQLAVTAVTCLAAVAPFVAYVAVAWQDVPAAGTPPHFPCQTSLVGGIPGLESARLGVYLPQLLILAAVPACLAPKRGGVVGAAIAGGILLSVAFGEYVQVAGTTFAMPYHALVSLPFFDRFWWPQRALAAVTVAAVVPLAALAARGPRWGFAAVAIAAISAAQAIRAPGAPHQWSLAEQPAWHRAVPPGPVLILPMTQEATGRNTFRAWPSHQRPLVNGMSMWTPDLWPPEFRRWTEQQALMTALLSAEAGVATDVTAGSAASLWSAGVVGVIATPATSRTELGVMRDALGEGHCEAGTCWWARPGSGE